jgi:hypothetical protein
MNDLILPNALSEINTLKNFKSHTVVGTFIK